MADIELRRGADWDDELTDAEANALEQVYEHFVDDTFETDSGTEYKMTSAWITDGMPHVMMVPLDSNGNERPINKREHSLKEFKGRFF